MIGLPRFNAWWEPHGEATFMFVEFLVPGGSEDHPQRAYEVIIVSEYGDYVSGPINV